MTHFNILTGVNRIFDDLEPFSFSMFVCMCVPVIALMCVCLKSRLALDPVCPTFMNASLPPWLLGLSAHAAG